MGQDKKLKNIIKTTIREFLNEGDINLKNVDDEFEIIKNSHWSSLKNYTLNDIVNGWVFIQNINNDNIKTIKYFVDNPELLKHQCLSYDEKGLADGYHRLTAMKIIGLVKFCYNYEDFSFKNFKLNESNNIGKVYFNDEKYPGFMYVKEVLPKYQMYWIGTESDEVISAELTKDNEMDLYWLQSPDGKTFAYEIFKHQNGYLVLELIEPQEMNKYLRDGGEWFPSDKG